MDQKSLRASGGLPAARVGPHKPRVPDHRPGQGGQSKESWLWPAAGGSSYRVVPAWPGWTRGAAAVHTPSAGVVHVPWPSMRLTFPDLLCTGHGTQPVLCTTHVLGAKAPQRKQPWGHVAMLLRWWRICPGAARTGAQGPHPEQTLPLFAPRPRCGVGVAPHVHLEGEEPASGSLRALRKVSGWDQGLVFGSDYLHHHRSFPWIVKLIKPNVTSYG